MVPTGTTIPSRSRARTSLHWKASENVTQRRRGDERCFDKPSYTRVAKEAHQKCQSAGKLSKMNKAETLHTGQEEEISVLASVSKKSGKLQTCESFEFHSRTQTNTWKFTPLIPGPMMISGRWRPLQSMIHGVCKKWSEGQTRW